MRAVADLLDSRNVVGGVLEPGGTDPLLLDFIVTVMAAISRVRTMLVGIPFVWWPL